MHKFLKFLLVFMLLIGFQTNITASASTNVSGIINQDTTWTLANSPYFLTEDIQIAHGVKLSIEPGVIIEGNNNRIRVFGEFSAIGNADSKIILREVNIEPGAGNSNEEYLIQIENANLIHGSLYRATGYGVYGSLILKDSRLFELSDRSFYIWYPTSDVTIERNVFINTDGISVGTSDDVKVNILNNVFYNYKNYAVSNWASYQTSETIVSNNSFLYSKEDGLGNQINSKETLVLPAGYGDSKMIATNNYWGTTDETIIEEMIFDKNDDLSSASYINFKPYLQMPHSNTPIIETIAPDQPIVEIVTNQSTEIKGKAEKDSTIEIFTEQNYLVGRTTTDNNGDFKINIELLNEQTRLLITATDEWFNKSIPTILVVKDSIPPSLTSINEVTDQSISVTGTAEINSLITVTTGTTQIGSAITSSDESYTVSIPKQKAGTKLAVTATDTAGNVSLSKEVTVIDKTAPVAPIVSEVTNKSTSITGTAEVGSTVVVKAGSITLGSGKASTEGKFSVTILSQSVGTVLSVTSTDNSGNVSAVSNVTITKAPAEKTDRLAGQSRYSTAIAISKEGWATSDTVIIATGADFPDALAGGPLAYKENAPILLTKSASLLAETEEEIIRLKAKKVIILGSTGAISLEVEAKLKQMGITTERIGGKNRFDTAALIAKRLPSNQAVVAYGFNFPDVLSISPYAAKNGVPILLTRTDKVPAETMNAMSGKTNTIIVGSTGAINDNVMKQFPKPVRYGGKNRFETGKIIVSKLPMGTGKAYVATGQNFPDALAGSVLAAFNDAPILLVKGKAIPTETNDLISKYDDFTILGSLGAVGDEVKLELDRVLSNK
ncbi:cell wall-binding repeat-containing protein [Paenisporosarcina sp. TG-14]|uniref:cell wall-binding repeat-containing protein n=1 Tax=Paenisporosarcina sp. TG-14 TaxID=1231057 RepID=UPI000304D3D3|nr:cell wall-binding repeat-containing protein [Paenisporosarcina sp. TG-14]